MISSLSIEFVYYNIIIDSVLSIVGANAWLTGRIKGSDEGA